jgi:quercetin dioxygenase-like cupin family protein
MPTQPFSAVLDELPTEERYGGRVQRSGLVSDGALFQIARVQPGPPEFGALEDHPFDQTIFLLSGEFEMLLDLPDGERVFRLGPRPSMVYIPPGVPHTGRCVGEEPAVLMDVFAPVRPDYLHLAEHQLALEPDRPVG